MTVLILIVTTTMTTMAITTHASGSHNQIPLDRVNSYICHYGCFLGLCGPHSGGATQQLRSDNRYAGKGDFTSSIQDFES